MPKILITGNGFDLNFGLPTRYSDFINILNSLEDSEVNFESIYSKTSNFSLISKNFKKFEFDIGKIEDLKKSINTSLWFNFFKKEYEIETWIDFENKIEYVLEILFSSIKYIKEKIFDKGSLSQDKLQWKPSLFNHDVEIIQVLNEFKILSMYENYTVLLNKEFLISKYGYYIDVDLDKITKKLYTELIDFKTIFNYYFEIFVFPFYDNLKVKVDRTVFSNIRKHYTFNYTPTFEKIYRNKSVTNFLHGRIDSKLNQIVIGINEIPSEELDKKYFLPFTKYFQKLNNDTDYTFLKEFDKKKRSNYMFFFWGHSLDKSDEDYINEVFDFINNLNSRIKKIIVIYHNKKSKSTLLINLLNIRGKADIQELMRSEILIFRKFDSLELKRDLKTDITQKTITSSSII